jgi:ADP-heptose:LPS heptosyltransferase
MRYPARAILAIDTSPFGQSLALLPSLDAIRQAYPNTRIVAAASPGIIELLAAYRLVDDSIILRATGPGNQWPGKTIMDELKLLGRTQHMRFDLVLAFSGLSIIQFLFRLRLRARIVSPLIQLSDLIDPLLGNRYPQPRHDQAAYNSILRQLGLKTGEPCWIPRSSSDEDARFEQLLHRKKSKGAEPVVVTYSTGPASFGWPPAKFADLSSRLSASYGVRTVVADIPYTSDFTAAMLPLLPKDAIKLRSPRAVEVVAAIARATMVVTDDSGIARFAARFGTPAIDMAGADSTRFGDLVFGVNGNTLATTDEVFNVACEVMQKSRTATLFQR